MKLAKVRHRFMAALLDLLIVLVNFVAITLVKLPFLISMLKSNEHIVSTKFILDIFRWGVICCFLFLIYYAVIPVMMKGQTIGKKVFKLKVVKDTGEDISYKTTLYREAIGGIFIFFTSLGVTLIASFIIMNLREDKKSLADILAKTKVIDLYESEE